MKIRRWLLHDFAWDFVGKFGVIGFVVAVGIALVARWLFLSSKDKTAELGSKLIGTVGGARNARAANQELQERRARKK